jgi:hypothetical protein
MLHCIASIPVKAWYFSTFLNLHAGTNFNPTAYKMGILSGFPGLKRLEREADNSPPSIAEVKTGGAVILLPSCVYVASCLTICAGISLNILLFCGRK